MDNVTDLAIFNGFILETFGGEFPPDEIYDTALEAWQAATLAQQKKVEALEIQVQMLREALVFYANNNSYALDLNGMFTDIEKDVGVRAKQALADTPNPSEWVRRSDIANAKGFSSEPLYRIKDK